jgi:hypothetical protein
MCVSKSFEIAPLDLSVAQVAKIRSESRSTVLRKLRSGRYRSYLSGGKRKIVAASVFADRELEMKTGGPVRPQPMPVTRLGRPRKKLKPETATTSPAGYGAAMPAALSIATSAATRKRQ